MPKAERGSVKDIANRMKAKGLQKLKFFCQMCEKQCRDANGFKCHLTSESHLRQMKIFSDNAGGYMERFSKDFERTYLATLRMRHGTKKVNANNVYQEVIADKQHIHMNSTHWATLSEFVQYLGKSGKVVVEETERGWFVTYIERDANILARNESLQRREEAERAAEEAQAQRMELQRVEAAKMLDRVGGSVHREATGLERTDDDRPIKVALSTAIGGTKRKSDKLVSSAFGDDNEDEDDEEELPPPVPKTPFLPEAKHSTQQPKPGVKRKLTPKVEGPPPAPKETSSKRPKHSKEKSRKDYWLYRDIIVRVISKKFADGKYFKRKAIVDKVIDKFVAEVEVMDSGPNQRDGGDVLRLDQEDLETVIPKELGKKVRILNGPYRGEKAKVEKLDRKNYEATLRLIPRRNENPGKDQIILERIPYEYFSKLA